MSENDQIELNLEFMEELRSFIESRVKNQDMAHGAVCTLTLLATQMACLLNNGDPVGTRNLMVGAINLALKHRVTTTKQ